MAYTYQEFIDRNRIFIDKKLQLKIKKTGLCFIGCGLSSVIAETAARTGFLKFLLADGDKVEFSNLNRQIFTTVDIGKNKAEATATVLKKINPLVKIKVIKNMIESFDMHKNSILEYDYIINTMDVNKAFFEFNKEACRHNKTILLPLNIGFGSFLMVFTRNSKRIDEIINPEEIRGDRDFFYALAKQLDISKLPKYIFSRLEFIFKEIDKKGVSPQLGIAANITAALTTTTIIKLIAKEFVPLAPDPILIDLFENI